MRRAFTTWIGLAAIAFAAGCALQQGRPEGTFSFATIGDNRADEPVVQPQAFRDIISHINNLRPQPDLVVIIGDLILGYTDDPELVLREWDEFDRTCSAIEPLSCMEFDTCEWYQTCEGPCPEAPPEICGGGDEDCDGIVDEEEAMGCQLWFADVDKDDFGDPDDVACLCVMNAPYTAQNDGDCNDNAFQINPFQVEVCNTLDDDCDGTADDFTEPCETPCGVGTRTCTLGVWSPCTEPNPLMCMNYATCQMESMCVAVCPVEPQEVCNGKDDDCDGSVDEGFQCLAGQTQSAACGNCGTKTRTCTSSCTWGSYGSCTGQGVCSPGATTQSGCDPCARKTCSSSCAWSGCQLLPGKTCLWENGTNWECCAWHKWHFCLPPSYGASGCKWSTACVWVDNACY